MSDHTVIDVAEANVRPPSLSEIRRGLMAIAEFGAPKMHPLVLDAAQQTMGCLFVVEALPVAPLRLALRRHGGRYRERFVAASYPTTFVIIGGIADPWLLGIRDGGFADDGERNYGLKFESALPSMRTDGRISRRILDDGDVSERIIGVFVLSLIADSRSPVTRVEADEKLNKARVKHHSAIPPYWRIEAGPTVLVPDVAPKPATAKGGTHASPRPHDRRGHPRHLKSGREVWVRTEVSNALLPHLTRSRSYYEVRI